MLITNVTVAGVPYSVDVRCRDGVIDEIGVSLPPGDEPCLDGAGGALLPGLHDHHLHLFALAAQLDSVRCGPDQVATAEALASALCADEGRGWLRAVGYHESVAGDLDCWQLDRIVSHRPLKVQHRSGKLWIVNSVAARLLSLNENAGLPGIELDACGRPNGRLFRLDDWMRAQLSQEGGSGFPSLAHASQMLASCGVTGVTDTSPDNGPEAMAAFVRAVGCGELLQRVRVMGDEQLPEPVCRQLQRGERKVLLDEDALPDWDSLCTVFEEAHAQGRAVAVHCVTPVELILTLTALRAVGTMPGDRIEHASLVPEETLPLLHEVGVRVVTQPGFIRERGDQYRADIDPAEYANLYRCRQLLELGIPLGGSTDAPYGQPDPWAAMRAAVYRASASGVMLGPEERLSPEQALALFTSSADDPGGVSRRVAVGQPADLCLLDRPWSRARERLCKEDVLATLCSGELIYHRGEVLLKGAQHASAA